MTFQSRAASWARFCFGYHRGTHTPVRNARFIEEALELVQARGMQREDLDKILTRVFSRPPGDADQEVGGVMVTLAALCNAAGMDMKSSGERELERCWMNTEKIRAKDLAKIPEVGI